VAVLSDFPSALTRHKTLLLGETYQPYDVVSARQGVPHAIVHLRGVDTMEAAEALRGQLVSIPIDAATKPRGSYFWHEIVGLSVLTEAGRPLGTVTEILRTGSNDVYVVKGDLGEILVPAIADVVQEIDVENGRIAVHLLPGMLPSED
jgi:16S rRNA processing protein RimM